MQKSDFEPGQEVDLDTMNVIVAVPTDTVVMDIEAQILDDNGEIMKAGVKCDTAAFRYFRDDYVHYLDDSFDIDTDFDDEDEEELMYIIIQIPRDAVSVTLRTGHIARTHGDAMLPHWCDKNMRASDIHEARELFLERIPFGDEYDARYTLTEKGKQALADLEAGRITPEELFGRDFCEGLYDD